MWTFLTPNGAYSAGKGQLGSIRSVYLRGNRIHARRDFEDFDEHVLMLHGFFQTRNIFEVLEDRLRHDGYGAMSFDLGGLLGRYNSRPTDQLARMVGDKIDRLCDKYGFDALHVVGHSKGGLVARRWIQHFGGLRRVKSLTTLGTPHHGTPTALLGIATGLGAISQNPRELLPRSPLVAALARDTFPAHVPFTSIYSRQDLVCPWWCSVLRPRTGEETMENVQVRGVGHSELCWDPGVYALLRERLNTASALYRERHGEP
ncbi:MAG: triacylglycerol lipase [Kiritimatiellia bacterium]|jgi:triacylglycerol lipase